MVQKDAKVYSDYTASSKANLLSYLTQQNISVPSRTEGRTSQHCERWAVFRLLATWANSNYLSYPLRLVHQDKPDFLLRYGGQEVGIESTEAVSEEWAATDALAEQMGVQSLLFMDQFKRGTPKRTASERREIIKNQPSGAGWGDGGFRREWALCMMDRVLDKTKDFRKLGFKKYDDNWLLIYDNSFLSFVDIRDLVEELLVLLNSYWSQKSRYDGVLIDLGSHLVQIDPTEWNQQPIVDLWT